MHPLCEILIRYRILNFKCGAIRIFFKGNTHSYQKVYLFTDAKLRENIVQQIIRGHRAGNLAQVIECLAYIHG
jgi:hypothetical protein